MDNVIELGNIEKSNAWKSPQYGRVYADYGISPPLTTMQGGGMQPKIMEIYAADDIYGL